MSAGLARLAAACWLGTAGAQIPPQDRTVRIPRISRPPALADFLDGRAPGGLARITDFRQQTPKDGEPASRQTTAYLGYDEKHLYAIFVCDEDPAALRANLSRREDIFADDEVGLYLDTFRDRQRTYEFFANPLGVQADGISAEGQADDYNFDTVWRSEGRLTPTGYVVLMAIPFRSLRFPDSPAQTWGLALTRAIPGRNEISYWPQVTQKVEGFAAQLATAEGLENVSPGRNLQFIPYGLFGRSRFLDLADGAGPRFRADTEWRGGIDAKVVLRKSLALDLTVNPDFSQVESDEPQVTINQRFEVFFPEKRPFFLENASYFQTPQNLLFSRRIANPEFGARLTGKVGPWALGLLAIDDRPPGQAGRAGIGVARVQREIGAQSTLGLMTTYRRLGDTFHAAVSFDARLKLNPNWVLTAQAVDSRARDPDGSRASGRAYYTELAHYGLHVTYTGKYRDLSPNFRSELGFVPRVDLRETAHTLLRRWRPAGRRIVSVTPGATVLALQDHAGRLQDWLLNPTFQLELTNQTFLNLGHSEAFERFARIPFRWRSTELSLASERKRIGLQAGLRKGTRVNYEPPSGEAPFLADSMGATARLTLRPTRRTKFDETYLFDRLTRGPAAVFNNHLLRSRLNYQFTRALSLRAILDYNATLPNPRLVSLERSKRLTGDLLLTYLLSAGTAFYAGYSDQRENLAIAPGSPALLARTLRPSTVTGRLFFVKASYAFRF